MQIRKDCFVIIVKVELLESNDFFATLWLSMLVFCSKSRTTNNYQRISLNPEINELWKEEKVNEGYAAMLQNRRVSL